MDLTQKLAVEMDAAEAARRLLEDKTLLAAFARLEASYTSAWRDTAPAQTAEREDAYTMLRALERLRRDLETVVQNGNLAEHTMRAAFRRGVKP